MLLYWIWLSRCKGLSLNKRLELAARWGDPKTVYEQADVADKDLAPAQMILDDCGRMGVQVLTIGDGAYPQRLKAIAEPPMVLYYKGVLPDFDREVAIGVVGTRRASAYGLLSAEKLARQMAERGGLVVSGMAAGIDAQAGWGALRAGKPTVAVLGGGVDVIYPTANRELYRAIEAQGCLISEYPPGTKPASWTFPQRNRIISGLCLGVLVVEAPEKSGTMITARDAQKQGRDLYVVPGHIDSEFCVGSNLLLQDGAQLVTSGWDVLRNYTGQYPDKLGTAPQPVAPKPKPAAATSDEQAILNTLSQGERHYDDIITDSGLDPQKALAVLTMLEIKGVVKTLPGRRAILNS